MKRRTFVKNMSLGGILLSTPFYSLLTGCNKNEKEADDFKILAKELLADWCDGMLKCQINKPEDPLLNGALDCPSCTHIHGRCMDAVYPFLYMADSTGDKKYIKAAKLVMEWAENNVSQDDGSWTVIRDPKSWKGISVFGGIALAEALYYHGHVLDKATYKSWMERLGRVAEYIYKTFNLTFTNVNYGFTSIYAQYLFGKVLKEPKYTERSRELAKGVKNYFTKPNKLLWGEVHPQYKLSKNGLHGVDMGYNVEESLNSIVMYAIEENDQELLDLMTTSLSAHAEFMLPDGGWDNSWGTRQSKWSYWGSRTTDGCQVGFGMMADHNPKLGKVAYQNALLLKECTAGGLIYGGPHYISHGIKPCIHHTFTHAKTFAAILDMGKRFPKIDENSPVPCESNYGVKEFPEISTWLVSNKSWRGTVTSYDMVYHAPAQQATGGALSLLYHKKAGLLFAASMAKYIVVEKNNQQTSDDKEFALTPRVEVVENDNWFTNLYDLEADVKCLKSDNKIRFDVDTKIQNESREKLSGGNSDFNLSYTFSDEKVEITAARGKGNTISKKKASLVLPVVSKNNEKVVQPSSRRIEINKSEGKVILESNVPLWIMPSPLGRVFNLVPGIEAIPVFAKFTDDTDNVVVNISVESNNG